MQKRENLQHRVLKNVELFRARQKRALDYKAMDPEQVRNQQYRELKNILSPFWAWRAESR